MWQPLSLMAPAGLTPPGWDVTVSDENIRVPHCDEMRRPCCHGAIQTTRGCPMNRTFCCVTPFNRARDRQRSITEVVREFGSIKEKRVLVVDDNLIGTRADHVARAKDLFRARAAANLGQEWVAQATINFADDEELNLTLNQEACASLSRLCGERQATRQEDGAIRIPVSPAA